MEGCSLLPHEVCRGSVQLASSEDVEGVGSSTGVCPVAADFSAGANGTISGLSLCRVHARGLEPAGFPADCPPLADFLWVCGGALARPPRGCVFVVLEVEGVASKPRVKEGSVTFVPLAFRCVRFVGVTGGAGALPPPLCGVCVWCGPAPLLPTPGVFGEDSTSLVELGAPLSCWAPSGFPSGNLGVSDLGLAIVRCFFFISRVSHPPRSPHLWGCLQKNTRITREI